MLGKLRERINHSLYDQQSKEDNDSNIPYSGSGPGAVVISVTLHSGQRRGVTYRKIAYSNG